MKLMTQSGMVTSKRLSSLLYERNKKAVDVSKETGISQSSISQYLSGRAVPNNSSAYKLGEYLNCDPLWIMGFDVPKSTFNEADKKIDKINKEGFSDGQQSIFDFWEAEDNKEDNKCEGTYSSEPNKYARLALYYTKMAKLSPEGFEMVASLIDHLVKEGTKD